MNSLPLDIENIIYKYVHQLKLKPVIDEIKKIEYEIDKSRYESTSAISFNGKFIEYFTEIYEDDEVEIYANTNPKYDLEVWGDKYVYTYKTIKFKTKIKIEKH